MTLRLNAIALLLISAAFVSCAGSDNTDYTDKSIIPEGKQNTVTSQDTSLPNSVTGISAPTPVQTDVNGINLQAAGVSALNSNVTAVSQAATVQNTGNVQLNPPHGQPNHRCDIAVGAPLNSPAGSGTTQPKIITTQQPAQNIAVEQQAQKTAPGMNPPHGEPNHRCDIAVGAPLNSKPASAPAPVPAQINSNEVQPLQQPVKADTSKS